MDYITVKKKVQGCPECKQEYEGHFKKEKHLPSCSRYVCPRCQKYRVDKCSICGSSTLP